MTHIPKQLIAAAPDLLEALEGLVADYDADDANDDRLERYIVLARRAIAKAKASESATIVSQYGDAVDRESSQMSADYIERVRRNGMHKTFDEALVLIPDTWTRRDLIDLLTWNDRNGTFKDADCDDEGIPRLTFDAAVECLRRMSQ